MEAPEPGSAGRSGKRARRGLAERLYRLLLIVYPRRRRQEDGAEMGEMFADIYRYEAESQGIAGRARLGAATVRDVGVGAFSDRRPMLDNFVQDIRHGVSRLSDNPMMAAAAALTLALGIGAVTSIFSFVDALVLNPLPYPEVDRVVVLGDTTPRSGLEGEGWTHPPELRRLQELHSLQSLAALDRHFVTMTGAGDPVEVIGYRATTNFFDVLGVAPALGRGFAGGVAAADVETDVVVLGYGFWQRHFGGDPEVLGTNLRLRDREAIVVGVMPRGAEFPMGTDLWIPLQLTPQEWSSYETDSLRTIGRLAPGATVERLRAELAPLDAEAARQHPETHADVHLAAEPILESITLGTRPALAFLMGAASFLLLLVCGNVANMQLAQAAARQQEMSMRMALGASRVRLLRQLLTESMVLAVLAAVFGALFAAWGTRMLKIGLQHERWRFFFTGVDIEINAAVLTFAVAVALASVFVFGLVPALHCSRVDLNEALKRASARGSVARGRLRRSLVVLEVALSVVLLAGAGLMANSVGAFTRFEPGVDTDVQSVRLRLPAPGYGDPARLRGFVAETLARAPSLAGVRSMAVSNRMPVTGDQRGQAFEADGVGEPAAEHRAERHVVDAAYFETLGISLLRGRGFDTGDDGAAPPVAIVSSRLADVVWPGEPALGKRLRFGSEDPWRTVVGVVTDVARDWNDGRPAAAIYLPFNQAPTGSLLLLMDVAGDAEGVMSGLRETIWGLDDSVVVFAPRSVDEALSWQAEASRMMTGWVSSIATVALLVCLAGIYALVAYAAVQRTGEIGVRLALGAERAGVVRMLVVQALRTAGVGLAFGLLLAYAVARTLAGFMEGVLAVDATVFLVLTGGMLALTALASWLPARRAARVDPVVTLRAE